MSINTPGLDRLVHQVIPGGRLLRAESLAGGISARVMRLDVVVEGADDGGVRTLVVRVPPNDPMPGAAIHPAEHDYRVLEAVCGAGIPAPAPLLLDMSRALLPTPYVVMDFLAGAPDFTRADKSASQLAGRMEQIARHLATIHTIDVAAAGLEFLPFQAGRVEWVLARPREQADLELDEPGLLASVVGGRGAMAVNPPVLLHGDLWPGNLLWQGERLTGILDWEDAAQGDPLFDLAVARLDLCWIFGEEASDAFTQSYRRLCPGLNYTGLPYWDLFAALRALPWLAQAAANWPMLGRPDLTEGYKRAAHRRFTQRALEEIRG